MGPCRDIAEPQRPTLLARRIARLPRRIPAPTVLLRAKWLIIIIIILYFLRSSERGPETTEKQKAREININKSSGQGTAGAHTRKRYPTMAREHREGVGARAQIGGEGRREERKTHIGRVGPKKTKGRKGREGRRLKLPIVRSPELGIYSWLRERKRERATTVG